MAGCGRWSMMHELGPLALRFVLATRHDVRRRADVQAEQDRRVTGIRLAEAAHSRPSHPYTKVCGRPPWLTASSHAPLFRAGWLLHITASRPRAATHAGTEP